MFRSRNGKIGLTVVAVALLAVAFVALRPTDETDEDQATTPAAVTTPAATTPATSPASRTTTTPEPEAQPAEVVPILRAGQKQTIRASRGETVRFAVKNTGDATEEVHVHGYDRYLDVQPGKTVTESFKADAEGGFEIELHGSGEQIGTLEVSPG